MATVTFFVDSSKTLSNKKHPVRLIVNSGGKQHKFKTGFSIKNREAFDQLWTSRKHDDIELRNTFNSKRQKAEEICGEMPEFSADLFKAKFYSSGDTPLASREKNLKELFEEKIGELKRQGKFSSAKIFLGSWTQIENYFGSSVRLEDLTEKRLKEFIKNLQDRPLSQSSVWTYTTPLRQIWNEQMASGKIASYPFKRNRSEKDKVHVPTTESSEASLDNNQMNKLRSYKPVNEAEKVALDWWWFSYHCFGMAPVDICNLRKRENLLTDRIQYSRKKTKGRISGQPLVVQVPLTVLIRHHIEKYRGEGTYLFPMFDHKMNEEEKFRAVQRWKRRVNSMLQKIGVKLGFSLNLYCARHSAAQTLVDRGFSETNTAKLLGDRSSRMVANYYASKVSLEVATAAQTALG